MVEATAGNRAAAVLRRPAKQLAYCQITLNSLSFAGRAGASTLPAHPSTLKSVPGRLWGRSAEKRSRKIQCAGVSWVPAYSITREIEFVCSFPGIRTRRRVDRRTRLRLPLLWSCSSRRSPRSTSGRHRPVPPLVPTHRRHGRSTARPDPRVELPDRRSPLYQALFSHKDPAA